MTLPPLDTERLRIRPLAADDLDAAARVLDGGPPDEARRRWLEWTILAYEQLAALYQPPYGERAVVRREDGALVGLVGLVPSLLPLARVTEGGPFAAHALPEVGLYWALAPEARGHGYATEAGGALARWALEHLDLARIVATTDHDNPASAAVMARIGMTVHRNTRGEPPWLQIVGVLERT
ncbi:MAG: GNAT family N-acetyltransferase [Myxococcota bacterium]